MPRSYILDLKLVYELNKEEEPLITAKIIEPQRGGLTKGYDALNIGGFSEKVLDAESKLKRKYNGQIASDEQRLSFLLDTLGANKTFEHIFDFHSDYNEIFPKQTLIPNSSTKEFNRSESHYLEKIGNPKDAVLKLPYLGSGLGVILVKNIKSKLSVMLDLVQKTRDFDGSKTAFARKIKTFTARHDFAAFSLQERIHAIPIDESGNLLEYGDNIEGDLFDPTMRLGFSYALLDSGEIKIELGAAYQKMPKDTIGEKGKDSDDFMSDVIDKDRNSPVSAIVPDYVLEELQENFIPKVERFLTDISKMTDLEIAERIVGDPLKEKVFENAFKVNPRDLIEQSQAQAGENVTQAGIRNQLSQDKSWEHGQNN